MVYVVGNGRSGTQTIAKVLSHANNAVVYHEHNVYPWLEMEKEFGNDYNPKLFREVMKWLPPKWAVNANKNGKVPIDSNHYVSPVIKYIDRALYNVKFIYLLRNPANIIRSWVNLLYPLNDKYRDKGLIYEIHRWRPFGKNVTSRFERLCLYWKHTNRKIRRNLEGTDHITVKVEDLCVEIDKIWEWLKLEGDIEKARVESKLYHNTREPARKPPFPRYKNWSDKHKKLYNDIVIKSGCYDY